MPRIYWDRHAEKSTNCIQRVIADEEAGQVVCETGRVLGSSQTYSRATLEGGAGRMTAVECRALAEALLVAADVLESKQVAPALAEARREYEERVRRSQDEREEQERRLAAEGVDLTCSGCGEVKRVLPEQVNDWLRSKPYCCRKRDRALVVKEAAAAT